MTPNEGLEGRIRALEDVRAIETLKYRYAELMDKGYDAEGLAALFVADGRWTASGFGDFVGQAQIRAFFAGMPASVEQAQHFVTSPQISLAADGGTAEGRFYLWCVSRTRAGPAERERFATVARYVDRFVKVDGRWLFASLHSHIASVFRLPDGAPQPAAWLQEAAP